MNAGYLNQMRDLLLDCQGEVNSIDLGHKGSSNEPNSLIVARANYCQAMAVILATLAEDK